MRRFKQPAREDVPAYRRAVAPKGAIRICPKDVQAEIYLFVSRNGLPAAMAFSGSRAKYDLYYVYPNVEQREKRLAAYLDSLRQSAKLRADRQAARREYRHDYTAGDILYSSWGYEQTNVNFYQVLSTTEYTITIREIAQQTVEGSEGFDSDRRIAVKNSFLLKAQTMTKRVSEGGYVTIEHHSAHRWDGKPLYCSWYH